MFFTKRGADYSRFGSGDHIDTAEAAAATAEALLEQGDDKRATAYSAFAGAHAALARAKQERGQ